MYTLVSTKKKDVLGDFDYVFKDFESFYKVANFITYAIGRRYQILIKTDNIENVQEFIKNEKKYDSLVITICMPESAVDYIVMNNINVTVKENINMFDIFKEQVSKRNILFEKGVMVLLYNSIKHELKEMEDILNKLVSEYGSNIPISEKMLSSIFVLSKLVYPRSVLIAYINMECYREYKLKKCFQDFGNDVILGSMVKNVKQFMTDKAKYYKTGIATKLVKQINTKNLCFMYKILVTERCKLNDITLLLALYERGLSVNDII
ncbi:MAG: hypothetical protein HFI05_00285 [Lachnospiraceae bacterium]|jgi:hypothetical protein|nr:hypothetical protein [Lachnospiraceae bacterium]